jgi:transposase
MARPYSADLRERVVAAVERDGMSRHKAAVHFGVGGEYGVKIRAVVASTPLAGLELARQVALTLDQEVSFGTARIAAAHSNSNAADRE